VKGLIRRQSLRLVAKLAWLPPRRRGNPLTNFLLAKSDVFSYFDPSYYQSKNRDLGDWTTKPWKHYATYGRFEYRSPSENFDARWYRQTYEDVRSARIDPLVHYLLAGRGEQRLPKAPPGSTRGKQRGPIDFWRKIEIMNRNVALQKLNSGGGSRGTILVVDVKIPTPDYDSGSARAYEMLQLLHELGWKVHFLALTAEFETRHHQLLTRVCDRVDVAPATLLEVLNDQYRPFSHAVLCRPEVITQALPLLRVLSPGTKILYDTVDLHWVRFERQMSFDDTVGVEQVALFRRIEEFGITHSDAVIAVSTADQATIQALAPDVQSCVIPNIVSSVSRGLPRVHRADIVFVGSGEHAPNRDCVRQLVEEIIPLADFPDEFGKFLIVGKGFEAFAEQSTSDRVEFLGYVQDLDHLLRRCLVMVAPLRFGAGMKGKILSAMANGLPVITTQIGAEGMNIDHEVNGLLAESPLETIDAIRRVGTDASLWELLSANGVLHIETVCGRLGAQRALETVLAS
jgi:glycosyltransferase involved in cell wall biosynthesis